MKTIKNGSWWDATCWDLARIPTPLDDIIVEHQMTSNKSIIIENKLYGRKGGLEFIGINMNNYVSGGHGPYEIPAGKTQPLHVSDVGLWATGAGILDIQGTAKTAWLTLSQDVIIGQTKITAPVTGWQVGDKIAFAPNEPEEWEHSETTVRGVNGNEITFDAVTRNHRGQHNPLSGKTHYTQVINLTRPDFYIKGTPTGKAHLLINSSKPQIIKNVLFQYMGPRKELSGDDRPELVKGRYALHFHHAGEGSRGSEIMGNVAIDCDNHCYVPHGSNGILIKDNIAYRVLETPYWWDLYHASTDITYDHNYGGDIQFINFAKLMDQQDPNDPVIANIPPTFFVSGMELGMGPDDRIIAINNCFAGMPIGDPRSGAAYSWQANNEGVWKFTGNIAHNCNGGVLVWQNTRFHHGLEDTILYNALTSTGYTLIFNGAYANPFRYNKTECFNGLVIAKAASQHHDTNRIDAYGQVWDNCIFDEFHVVASPLKGEEPLLIRNSKIKKIVMASGGNTQDDGQFATHNLDIVDSTFTEFVWDAAAGNTEVVRVQTGDTAYKWTKTGGKVTIPKFYFGTTTPPPPPPPVYKNAAFTKQFTRNNCGTGFTGSSASVTVTLGQFTSTISQADADLQANTWGQNEANRLGTCTAVTTTFKNVAIFKTFTRNNCPAGTTAGTYTYTVAAGKYSASTQAAADLLATNDINTNGQSLANINATCAIVVVSPVVTQKAKLTVDITSNIIADYMITNYYNNITPYRTGKTIVGTITVDITNLRNKTIYLFINGKMLQKI